MLCSKDVFSCWNTSTGARSTNYGSRIDLVLAGEAAACGQEAEQAVKAWVVDAVGRRWGGEEMGLASY